MAEKYVDHRPDVVIALGEPATRFIVDHREAIAPDAKIVFGGFGRDSASKLNLPADVVGAFSEFDIAKTLELARALQPDAKTSFHHRRFGRFRSQVARQRQNRSRGRFKRL